MGGKKKKGGAENDAVGHMRRMALKRRAGMEGSRRAGENRVAALQADGLPSLAERVSLITSIVNVNNHNPSNMIYFVMYDIESNKVRRAVVKYLEKKGCHRIQKSIFMADTPAEVCDTIRKDLAEVQQMYDNHDSIMIVPVSMDHVRAMSIIGLNVDVEMIVQSRGTMFF